MGYFVDGTLCGWNALWIGCSVNGMLCEWDALWMGCFEDGTLCGEARCECGRFLGRSFGEDPSIHRHYSRHSIETILIQTMSLEDCH